MSSKTKLLLLSCGSFNPITHMHLRIFELARDTLHKTGLFEVVGGIMSPTHDAYKKAGLIESKHRTAMCQLGTKSSDWIRVSLWESEQAAWSTTITVLKHIQENAKQKTQPNYTTLPDNVRVRLLCGADLMESFSVPGLWKDEDIKCIVGEFGLVVITREGCNPEQYIEKHHILQQFKDNITLVEEWIPNEISATKIRYALNQNESIKYLVPDPVINYIKEHGLYSN
eukprot:TCONS_00061202-protein